jgi:hypothetical protein
VIIIYINLVNNVIIFKIATCLLNIIANYDILLLGGDIMPYFNPHGYTRYKVTETEQNNDKLGKQSHVSGWKITGISALIILSCYIFLLN